MLQSTSKSNDKMPQKCKRYASSHSLAALLMQAGLSRKESPDINVMIASDMRTQSQTVYQRPGECLLKVWKVVEADHRGVKGDAADLRAGVRHCCPHGCHLRKAPP